MPCDRFGRRGLLLFAISCHRRMPACCDALWLITGTRLHPRGPAMHLAAAIDEALVSCFAEGAALTGEKGRGTSLYMKHRRV